jgi:AcrR family transcriptional regulator
MGLREVKVARTRAQIVDVALDLFIEQGYEMTTMEEIAARAEVGSSTLYRYFPSKDLLVLDPLVRAMDLASLLRLRPDDEPLALSLGVVIRESYPAGDMSASRFVAIRRVVDGAPGPRARLWDLVQASAAGLADVVAERLGRPADDLGVVLTVGTAYTIYQRAGEEWRGKTRASWERAVDRTLEAVGAVDVVLPAP